MKDISIRIINVILIIVTVISAFSIGALIYYKTFGKDKIPTAITSTYATFLTDPMTNEQIPVLSANYYSNVTGNGKEVIEFMFNGYSGVSKQAIYSRGFQLVYDKDESGKKTSTLYYYDSYYGNSYQTGHEYNFDDKSEAILIDIDGKLFGLKLDGTYTVPNTYFDGWKLARSIGFMGLNFIFEDTDLYVTETETHKYSIPQLLEKIASIIRSFSSGTGDSLIPLIDLGDFLHLYEYDEDSKQLVGQPIGLNTLTNSYFTIQTHYDKRGLVWYKQSMFNSVAYDSSYNKSGLLDNVEYWKSTTVYNLTEKDFVSRYSQQDNGWFYSLSNETISELKNYDNTEINITFDISKFGNGTNVVGFDYYAFYGLKINSLTIKSNTERQFTLLVNSLKDTGLTSITLENVTLNNINSGVELWN